MRCLQYAYSWEGGKEAKELPREKYAEYDTNLRLSVTFYQNSS